MRRLERIPGKLTVYLVRKHWSDTRNIAQGRSRRRAGPSTWCRSPWRRLAWASADLDIAGAAGEVIFVEVISSVRVFSGSYRLERGDAVEPRQRAISLRLVVDVG